jgi:hypothetical protein
MWKRGLMLVSAAVVVAFLVFILVQLQTDVQLVDLG